MAHALDVAKYLIHLASTEEEPDYLTHLRLQKLLYYVQGWSLAMRDQPMFDSRIEAWAHGPVVRDLFSHFTDRGNQSIPPESVGSPDNLTAEEEQFIGSVWEQYKGFSATSLWKMTHGEPTWVEARAGLAPADRGDREITREKMKDYFSKLAE